MLYEYIHSYFFSPYIYYCTTLFSEAEPRGIYIPLRLKEYLQKSKRLIPKRVLTHEEKSLLTEEGIPVASLETYLLTFSKKSNNKTNRNI